ncbi:MAG: hypothetical protein ABIL23_01100, partial [candidate division WOR-3 bacterium]
MLMVLSYWAIVKPVGENADALGLANRGVKIYEYIPQYGYIAYIPNGVKLPNFQITGIPEELKIAKEIYEGKFGDAKEGSLVEL